jgi:protein-S-isoprenylcysteine O-methyltransferase Ste14
MMFASLIEMRPPRVAMSITLVAAAVHLFYPIAVHASATTSALVIGFGGAALMLRAWWLFRHSGTAICPTAASSMLVTHDVFSFTRNPMYLGMTIMIAAFGIATGSASFYVAAFAYAFFIDRVFCPYEEHKALTEFGDQYLAYQRRVRRWF